MVTTGIYLPRLGYETSILFFRHIKDEYQGYAPGRRLMDTSKNSIKTRGHARKGHNEAEMRKKAQCTRST